MRNVLLAVAALVLVVFGYQASSAPEPGAFSFADSRPYAAAFIARHCRDIGCDHSQGKLGLFVDHYQTEEGWVWVLRTKGEPGETHVLFPAADPAGHRILLPVK